MFLLNHSDIQNLLYLSNLKYNYLSYQTFFDFLILLVIICIKLNNKLRLFVQRNIIFFTSETLMAEDKRLGYKFSLPGI
jgi:hypothetical protein